MTNGLFPERPLTASKLDAINIVADVKTHHKTKFTTEEGAVEARNEGTRPATEVGDNRSRELFESILKDGEAHIERLEAELDQIKQIGIQNYVAEQIRKV
jgi:bacterioferritin